MKLKTILIALLAAVSLASCNPKYRAINLQLLNAQPQAANNR